MRAAKFLALFGAWMLCGAAQAVPLSPDNESARDAALQWLQLVDSGDYQEAVLQTSKQIGIQQNWMSYLSARRTPLGRLKSRQIAEVNQKPTVRGAQVWSKYKVILFRASFERRPAALEEVVLTKVTCCWEVSGYTVFESESDRHSGKWKETGDHAGQFSEPGPERH